MAVFDDYSNVQRPNYHFVFQARLYSYAPQQAAVNPRVLRFNRLTQTQMRKSNVPVAPKLEPVVCLYFF